MPSLDDVLDDLRAALPDLLVATDFDGTLAPIVPDPQDSRPVPGAIEALAALADAGARVAVITGRDAHTVVRLGGLHKVPGVVVAGIYGIETWHDGHLDTPDEPEAVSRLRDQLPAVLADAGADPAVWVEDKRLSLVVHARQAADPDAALTPLVEPVTRLAEQLGLEPHPGRDVLELRVPGYDKAGALRRLAGDSGAVVFLGDDVGDVPAFAEMAEFRAAGRVAWGVAVSHEVPEVADAADVVVDTPEDAAAFLRRVAGH